MVAEDIGSLYEKCQQMALVSLGIEKQREELSEQEIGGETKVKANLQHCFDGKEEILAMAKGHSLDKLVTKVMD